MLTQRSFTRNCILATCAAIGLAGCGSGNNSLGPGGNTTSRVRMFNALACPDASSLDVAERTNTEIAFSGVGYSQATDYVTLPSGNGINHFILKAGTRTEEAPQTPLTLKPNTNYTFAAIGDCAQTISALSPKLIELTDTVPNSLNGSMISIRLVNITPSADLTTESVDLYNQGQPIGGLGGVLYGKASEYVTLPSGPNYDFTVRTTGSHNPVTIPANSLSTLNSDAAMGGGAYTVFLIGEINGSAAAGPLNIKIVKDNP